MKVIILLIFEIIYLSVIIVSIYYKPLLLFFNKHDKYFMIINIISMLFIEKLFELFCTPTIAWISSLSITCIIILIVIKRKV